MGTWAGNNLNLQGYALFIIYVIKEKKKLNEILLLPIKIVLGTIKV